MTDQDGWARRLKAVRNHCARRVIALPGMVNNETILLTYVVSLTLQCAAKWFLFAIWYP